jgi:hypothetical protein
MNTYTQQSHKQGIWKLTTALLLLLALYMTSLSALADASAADVVRAAELSGNLGSGYSVHYLAVEPSERDSTVSLTMVFGPRDDARLIGRVNFWVLSLESFRQVQGGAKPYDLAIATGNPIPNKDDKYQVQAAFKAVARQTYMVMVRSNAAIPSTYTLTASKAMLVDASGQTVGAVASAAGAAMAATASTATSGASWSRQTAGELAGRGARAYLTVVPKEKDASITLTFDYDPKNDSQLTNGINFFVLNADGLRSMEAGARLEQVNLAAGNVVKSGETKLNAKFKAVNMEAYTVVVVNRSALSACYTLSVDGGYFQE